MSRVAQESIADRGERAAIERIAGRALDEAAPRDFMGTDDVRPLREPGAGT